MPVRCVSRYLNAFPAVSDALLASVYSCGAVYTRGSSYRHSTGDILIYM